MMIFRDSKPIVIYKLLIILIFVSLLSCQVEQSKLFDDVNQMAKFEGFGEPTLIQHGKESGFLMPLMTYGIFSVDTSSFQNLLNSIRKNEKFKSGSYYLNLELDDFIRRNNLEILNMANCLITQNKYDKSYHGYLLSDNKTVVICEINH